MKDSRRQVFAISPGEAPTLEQIKTAMNELLARNARLLEIEQNPKASLVARLRAKIDRHGPLTVTVNQYLPPRTITWGEEPVIYVGAKVASLFEELERRTGVATVTRVSRDGLLQVSGGTIAPTHSYHRVDIEEEGKRGLSEEEP